MKTVSLVLIGFTLFCIPGAGWSEDKGPNHDVKPWIDLGFRELKQSAEEDRVFAAQMFALTLVELGELEAVGRVVEESLPEREKHFVKMVVAVHQGLHERLENADRTIRELPPEQQESAWALLVVRLAQANRLEEAEGVLQKITKEVARDRAIVGIAEAYAASGDAKAARHWAKQIKDNERREQTLQKIQQGIPERIEIEPKWLNEQILVLSLFSSSERTREAILAVNAIQNEKPDEKERHFQAALKQSRDAVPHEKAMIFTYLALVLVEENRVQEAREMIMAAKAAGDNEWLGISSLFGNPVLIYRLMELNLEAEIEEIVVSARDSTSSTAELTYLNILRSLGSSYASLNRLKAARKYFESLESSKLRVHFVTGVLSGFK